MVGCRERQNYKYIYITANVEYINKKNLSKTPTNCEHYQCNKPKHI